MKYLLLTALSAVTLCAGADRLLVHGAQMGSDTGKVVLTGDQLLFVDDTNPLASFSIPRADVLSLRDDNGLLSLQLASGWVRLTNPASTPIVVSWTGLPLNTAERMTRPPAGGVQFDIRHDDDTGRLIIGQNDLNFDCLSDARKSRRWAYGEIQEFKRDSGDREFKMKMYGGENWKFQVTDGDISDDVYDRIADRIVSARRP